VIEHFSSRCRAALAAAENEARRLNHGQIATEHVLLGLLRIEESVAAQALRLLGVTYRKAKRRIVRLVDVGSEPTDRPLLFTPRVREVIEDAFTGSIWLPRLGQSLVGPEFKPSPTTPFGPRLSPIAPRLNQGRVEVRTEDLLLALIAHGEGIAATVLAELGVDLEKAAAAGLHARFGPSRVQSFFDLPFRADEWPPAPPKQN
jgi:ATP-dependent Clp protease ATP-binding subunit ClpC